MKKILDFLTLIWSFEMTKLNIDKNVMSTSTNF